jgi:predicted metal-binding membrane protein
VIVAVALAAAAVLAWVWLLRSPMGGGGDMAGMSMGPAPLSAAYLAPAFAMWAIMMVAMMVPSAAPMILLHARIDKAPTSAGRTRNSLLFALSYLLVWTAFSAVAALAQALLVRAGLVSEMALAVGDGMLAAALLGAAAAYELTLAKRLCLDKCQSPMLFILRYWKPGAAGAVRLGLTHGLYCLGCCWALMLLLFVGGVMNLAWVALLGIVVLAEKFAPPAWRAERLVAAALVIAAIAVLIP